MSSRDSNGYKPISDYAVIGNLRTVALVARDGSIDWCCFPRLDKGSVFGALLDARRGGRFRVCPVNGNRGEQTYIKNTNVLRTQFRPAGLHITDLMPISGNIHGCHGSTAAHEIHRILECGNGSTEVEVEWSPRFDYGTSRTRIDRIDGGWVASAGRSRLSLSCREGEVREGKSGPVLHARFKIKESSPRVLVCRWDSENTAGDTAATGNLLAQTVELWKEWTAHEKYASHEWSGKWADLIVRSQLLLKLLSHNDTGAIAAAPTTSLPETVGGIRNWDYRYTWIRDASLTGQALLSMGHWAEAVDYLEFLERIAEQSYHRKEGLQVLYGLHGERNVPEVPLPHWGGYRGSAPVNIGNLAEHQFQLGVFGELLNTAYELARRGRALDRDIQDFLKGAADQVVAAWKTPDHGIWEIRGAPRHFTYSKVMAWTALDRAIKLAKHFEFPGNVADWRRARDEIRSRVLEQGFNNEIGSFVISFGSRDLDAANLRIPLLQFLPFDDPRIQGTINRTREQLTENGMVLRYRIDDGLPGKEGTFNLCTFWLVDALALSGRVGEAEEIFDNMASHANHCGLFAEEIDPRTGEFLGNFPQAFSHVGLINSAIYLAHAKGKKLPEYAQIGTPAHKKELESAE